MATLLSRIALAKFPVFHKKMAFACSKGIHIGFLVQIRNQRIKIDFFAKFQQNIREARILTWNNTENCLMTSYLPHSEDISKNIIDFGSFFQSTIMPSFVVIGPQIKEKQRRAQCAPSPEYILPKSPNNT